MPIEHDLTDSVALVTGASRGIGRVVAEALAEAGCDVALVARSEGDLEETAALVRAQGRRALVLPADLSEPAESARVVERCVDELGRLDVLVNNAGIMHQALAWELEPEDFARVMTLNVTALAALTRYALPHLMERSRSAVVNVASVAGRRTFRGGGAYCASKHAVIGYSGSAFDDAREAGVKVSAICPGYVNTPMVNTRPSLDPDKMIRPADVALAVLFVARFPDTGCPTEIVIRPQRSPYRG